MAWQFPLSTSVVSGYAVILGDTDSVFVAESVLVASDYEAIFATGSNQEAVVAGTVGAWLSAVRFGNAGSSDHDNSITVEAGADIRSFDNLGIVMDGYRDLITNHGSIYGERGGILLNGISSNTVSTILNSGTISSNETGIARYWGSTETIALSNSGIVAAPTAYGGYQGQDMMARDIITNTGRISGTIDFGSGNDVYSGATGRLSGKVLAGAGDDSVTGGIDSDWFDGGAGNDGLTGNGGNDRLLGQAGNDILRGVAGNDLLDGGAGIDKLFGGAGNDRLIGGVGNDYFTFDTALKANVDRIADFSHVDDAIRLENAVFKGIGANGQLAGAFFFAGAAAHDANDRIVYNRANGNLYHDDDGTGAHAQVLFAVIENRPANLAANDFVVI